MILTGHGKAVISITLIQNKFCIFFKDVNVGHDEFLLQMSLFAFSQPLWTHKWNWHLWCSMWYFSFVFYGFAINFFFRYWMQKNRTCQTVLCNRSATACLTLHDSFKLQWSSLVFETPCEVPVGTSLGAKAGDL